MCFSTKSQIFAIAFSIALVVLLNLLPSNIANKTVVENNSALGIEEAVELVKSGSDPMKGILKLRKIAEDDPNNVEAQFYLGIFSVQSGQLKKAITRLTKVLELDHEYIALINDEKRIEEVEKHIKELKIN